MDDEIDTVGPWTIKTIGNRVRKRIIDAAHKEGLSVGQWLERRANEWLDDGGPVRVSPGQTTPVSPVPMAEQALMLREVRESAQAAGIPVPKAPVRQAAALLTQSLRASRGLPPPAKRGAAKQEQPEAEAVDAVI